MAVILIIGCGDLGAKVAELLQAEGHILTGVRRSAQQMEKMTCIQADVTQSKTLSTLKQLKPNIIIYCVAADAQNDDNYRRHYVEGLRNVLESQKENDQLQHVFFISSTRVYGQEVSELLNETVMPVPNDFGGRRLLEAESLLETLACSSTVLRLSGIYGHNRLYLLRLLQDASRWPIQNRWTNRIHRDDAANFLAFLCRRVIQAKFVEDCYIVTDNMPVKLSDVLAWLAKEVGVPRPSFVKNSEINGKRLDNQRLRTSGFLLQYPNFKVGYKAIIENV